MSRYTTQVRYICETYAGVDSFEEGTSVDEVLEKSWRKIFDDFPIWLEGHRVTLCKLILKSYYQSEIAFETVGLWKMQLNLTLQQIMPYYNKLYQTTVYDYEPLENYNMTDAKKSDKTGENSGTNSNTLTNNLTQNTDGNNWRYFSDTPQSSLSGVQNRNYLSEATNDTIDQTVKNTGTQSNSGKESGVFSENYNETITKQGKDSSKTYQELIMQQRETIINIDMLVVEELKYLFMGVF